MATVMAGSIRGAVNSYMIRYTPMIGDVIDVKKREEGDWESFKIYG